MFRNGTFTIGNPSSTFTISSLPFQPKYIRFTLGGRFNTNETHNQLSQGWTDATRQGCHAFFRDATGTKQRAFADRVIHHYAREGGVIVDNIVASFVSFNPTGFTLNATAADANYQVYYEAFA